MLKIPTSTDTAPPLLAPLRRTNPEEPVEEKKDRHAVKKRRKSKKAGSNHSWENDTTTSRRGEGNRMRWFLIGGAALLAISIGGLIIAMNKGSNPQDRLGVVIPTEHLGSKPDGLSLPKVAARSELDFLAESEAVARKFLTATTVDQLLPLVRNPDQVEPKMRKFYQDGTVKAEGISQFNSKEFPLLLNGFRSVSIVTGDFEEKPMVFTDSVEEIKVDWESWVGWSAMSRKEFTAAKPVEAQTFRVYLSAVNYYNFDFKDEDRWQSFRLEFPDHNSVYGYVERFSDLAKSITLNPDEKSVPLMLSLKFLPNATSDQVVIERLVNRGWVEQDDKK